MWESIAQKRIEDEGGRMEAEIAVAGWRARTQCHARKWKAREIYLSRYYAKRSHELGVATAKVGERLTVRRVCMYDFAHDYRVIAAWVLVHNAAL